MYDILIIICLPYKHIHVVAFKNTGQISSKIRFLKNNKVVLLFFEPSILCGTWYGEMWFKSSNLNLIIVYSIFDWPDNFVHVNAKPTRINLYTMYYIWYTKTLQELAVKELYTIYLSKERSLIYKFVYIRWWTKSWVFLIFKGSYLIPATIIYVKWQDDSIMLY
jgi:hypothetical protein